MDPIANFRFGVFFFAGGLIPNPLDIRFQSVGGLNAEIGTVTHREGGELLYSHRLPDAITYQNLVLKRGVTVGSPLTIEFNAAMTLFKFAPSNVLVTALSEDKVPLAGWMFIRAYPVRWLTSELSADSSSVMIETMELAYARMQVVRV
ncbi:phage tail protein [Sphingomonas sp. HF-S4]|uniref:Phage tail protein n=1 Tax=Sphingomonas agrestis TaxID=3080540 RepID=A0ABU3Y1Y1_9SPHN|nr:phage tail protein [Sphingomonas sp. HF-S4]MDV3455390.1 phage tail protein [Sphingomonas sp. HF-S4]